ncbi:hypothetical protein RRG08_042530 [Elysia crispata]|uniref:Uncharacterized protein n=1 Tax=Elysia crispata TaxID=231223 RepID=A0AAE0XQ08_9GAST|nr:hypothetical protein RRG08_042530 [Elysia crispata]
MSSSQTADAHHSTLATSMGSSGDKRMVEEDQKKGSILVDLYAAINIETTGSGSSLMVFQPPKPSLHLARSLPLPHHDAYGAASNKGPVIHVQHLALWSFRSELNLDLRVAIQPHLQLD